MIARGYKQSALSAFLQPIVATMRRDVTRAHRRTGSIWTIIVKNLCDRKGRLVYVVVHETQQQLTIHQITDYRTDGIASAA